MVSVELSSFDPKSEPKIDNEMEPEDGPLYSFKWDTDNVASQSVAIKTTKPQSCRFRAIHKDSRINNCRSALRLQCTLPFFFWKEFRRWYIRSSRGIDRLRYWNSPLARVAPPILLRTDHHWQQQQLIEFADSAAKHNGEAV